MLKILDRIYGEIVIDDPVVISLIETPAFQRLKKINQYGGVNFVYTDYQVSRYEHSIGVWWLLKNLNTSKEIQISGLLHDIAHSAFSHMLDMAREDKDEKFHEDIVSKFGLMKPVNKILKASSIHLVDLDLCPEIKVSLPDVGADRIDYAIRDYYGAIGENTLFGKKVIQQLIVKEHKILFTDINIASEYALTGLKAMWKVIYDPKVAVVYQSIIEMFRTGLKEKWVQEQDLMQDDLHMLEVFKKNRKNIKPICIKIFELPYKAIIVDKKENYDFFHIKLKARYFDPLVNIEDEDKRLSELNKTFRLKLREKVRLFEDRKKGVYIKVNFLNKN